MKNLAGIKVMILGDESGAVRAMMAVDKRAGMMATNLQRTGKMMMGLGAGVLTAIGAGTLAMGRNAGEIVKQSKEVGMAAEDYQRYSYSVQQAGGSADDFTRSMTILRKASVAAVDGNKTAIALFDRLGISYKNADGSARNTKDIVLDLSNALAKGKAGPEEMAAAVQLLGRGGKELIQWTLQGKDAIMAMAAATPNVISNEDLKKLKDFNNLVLGLKIKLIGVASEGLAKITPYLEKFIGFITRLADRFEALSSETKQQIGRFILLGSVALIAGGGLAFLVGKITAVVLAAKGLASIGTFLSGVNPQILAVVAGLLTIWWGLGKISEVTNEIAAVGAEKAYTKESARLGKEMKSGKITQEQYNEGFRTPDMVRRKKLIAQAATGDMRPEWAPGKVMEEAGKGIGIMMGEIMNKYLPAATPAPIPAPAGLPPGMAIRVSDYGPPPGIREMLPGQHGGTVRPVSTLPSFGANTSVSQTGQNLKINAEVNIDNSADFGEEMQGILDGVY